VCGRGSSNGSGRDVVVIVGGRGSSTCVGVPDVHLLLSVDIGDRTTVGTWICCCP
jgi:hypothetical protein